jgi:hypothetical protein
LITHSRPRPAAPRCGLCERPGVAECTRVRNRVHGRLVVCRSCADRLIRSGLGVLEESHERRPVNGIARYPMHRPDPGAPLEAVGSGRAR